MTDESKPQKEDMTGFARRVAESLRECERRGELLVSCPGLSIHIPPLVEVLKQYASMQSEVERLRGLLNATSARNRTIARKAKRQNARA